MHIKRNAPLKAHNTLALAASARALARVESNEDLLDALAWAEREQLPVVSLGEGSNIVFGGDVDALLLRQANRGIDVLDENADHVLLRVAAGENWHQLVRWTLAQGYYGLENLALIPGSVGAAPIQNIGAYGVELSGVLESVQAVCIDNGEALQLDRNRCGFGYRDSVFKGELRDQLVITCVDLRLSKNVRVELAYPALAGYLQQHSVTAPSPRDVFDAVVAIRSSKLPDPAQTPNAGSFFKNPIVGYAQGAYMGTQCTGLPRYPQPDGRFKLAAAWLIEQCGWKGYSSEGVGVHPQHALVLVNHNGSGAALLDLASRIVSSVQQRFGVDLEIEPRVYGAHA